MPQVSYNPHKKKITQKNEFPLEKLSFMEIKTNLTERKVLKEVLVVIFQKIIKPKIFIYFPHVLLPDCHRYLRQGPRSNKKSNKANIFI